MWNARREVQAWRNITLAKHYPGDFCSSTSSSLPSLAAQVHFAVVLAKARILDTDPAPFPYVDAIVEHAARIFDLRDQLLYLCLLPAVDRRHAYTKILKLFGGAAEELVGRIQEDGSHSVGLLEQAIVMESGAAMSEYQALMEANGTEALKRGRYVSGLRMLHLAGR